MPEIHAWDGMDRLACADCRVSGNDSGHQGHHQQGESHPGGDPGPAASSPPFLPEQALAFISAAGVACIISNALLAAALLRTRGHRSPPLGEKALALRRRIRGLLLNLALTDLLSVSLLAPLEVLALSKDGAWDFGAYPCRLFLGADVLLGSAASYALAALALHAVHFWAPGPFVSFSWLLSASLSVPVFVLADVVSLPTSPYDPEPRPHCSLPLAMLSGAYPRPPEGGGPASSAGAPLGLLLLRLSGAALGFVLPTLIVLVSNVEAVVAYVRSDPRGQEEEETAAVRELEDESVKLCFALSLTHVFSTFPRFAYSLISLAVPDPSSALRIPPLASPAGLPSAFYMAVLHYSAPALRPAVVVATSAPLRRSLFSSPSPVSGQR